MPDNTSQDFTQIQDELSNLRSQVTDTTNYMSNNSSEKFIASDSISNSTFSSETKFIGKATFNNIPTIAVPNSTSSLIASRLSVITKTNTLTNTINNTLGLDEKATTVNLATGSSMTSFNIHTNTHITGDLTVSGTKTSIETDNTIFTDNLVGLNNGLANTDPPTKDCGIIINRGSADNAFIGFDESHDMFVVGTTQESADTTESNLLVTPGTLNVGILLLNGTIITGSYKVLGSAVQLNNLSGIKDNFGLMLDLVTDGGLEITTDNKLQIKEDGVTNSMLATITEPCKVAGSALQLKASGGVGYYENGVVIADVERIGDGLIIADNTIIADWLAPGAVDLSSAKVTGVLPVEKGGIGKTMEIVTSTMGLAAFAERCKVAAEENIIEVDDYALAELYRAAAEAANLLPDKNSIDVANNFYTAGLKYLDLLERSGGFNSKFDTEVQVFESQSEFTSTNWVSLRKKWVGHDALRTVYEGGYLSTQIDKSELENKNADPPTLGLSFWFGLERPGLFPFYLRIQDCSSKAAASFAAAASLYTDGSTEKNNAVTKRDWATEIFNTYNTRMYTSQQYYPRYRVSSDYLIANPTCPA